VKYLWKSKGIYFLVMPILCVSGVLGQGLSESKANIDSTNFYVFSEAGGIYIPSIKFDTDNLNIPFSVTDTNLSLSGNYSVSLSDFVVNPDIGYNFIIGTGYQINENFGIELEVGYSSASLGSGSFTTSSSPSVSGTVNGAAFSGTGSGSGNGTISSSSSITYIPILINMSVQERSGQFQPMASLGLGVCPTIISSDQLNINWTESGTISNGVTTINYSAQGLVAGISTTQTAYPFAFKLKAGFDYELNRHASLGLRAWAMGLANSDFGDGLQSDLYGAVGLNASFKVRF
jgi:outer membrane protein W